jgi:hypothetical protein
VIFLRAFGLAASVNDLLLLLVLTLAAGSLPIKIPGAGTVATTAALAVAGIHGPGVAGFVLVSRVVFSSETAVLALALLGWWNVRRSHQCDHGGAQALLLLRTASTPR